MNIAIVEDRKSESALLRALLGQILTQSEPSVSEFSDETAFFCAFSPGKFDIVFLDIYLGRSIGMDIARRIRETDKLANIVFTTQSSDYAVDSYNVRAAYYLLKPIQKEKLILALDACESFNNHESRFIEVMSGRRLVRIRLGDIRYAEHSRNTVLLRTTHGCEKVYTSFADFAPMLLGDARFLQCYHGCIVNMDCIEHVDESRFILSSGDIVQINKRSKAAIKAAYHQYAFTRTMRGESNPFTPPQASRR